VSDSTWSPGRFTPVPTEDKAEWPRTGLDSFEKTKIPCSYQDSNSESSTYSEYAIPWQSVVSYINCSGIQKLSICPHNIQCNLQRASLRRPVLEHRPVHRDLWRTVALGQVLLRDLRSFGILRSVEWYFRTDVSIQYIGAIFRGQAVQEQNKTIYIVYLLYIYVFIVCLFINCMFMYLHRASWHSSATLTEVFPCFFLSCKTNAWVKPAKMGHGPHSS
jgi:hypothetical protein